jgi:hypothetical protein
MFPIRLMIGAIVLLVAIALTPLLWKAFDARPAQSVALNPAPAAPARPSFAVIAKVGGNNAPLQVVTSGTPHGDQPRPEPDPKIQEITGSLPEATASKLELTGLDPSTAIEFPTSAPAVSAGAKVKHARVRPVFRRSASQQPQNAAQYAFGQQQQTKPAKTEYAPVPLPTPNFTNSGY